jgi:hypothetical protein
MKRPVPRLALRADEAAVSLDMSTDHFERQVADGLRPIYVGRVKVYAVAELERWLERQAMSAPAAVRESAGRSRDRMDRGAA